MATQIPAHWVNKKKVAELLNISVQAFGKWGVEPVGKSGREVYFTLRDVIDNRLENEAKQGNLDNHTDDAKHFAQMKQREEAQLARERRIGQELKNELAAGTVIPTEFATFALSRVAAQIATILDTLPLTLRRAHPDLESRHIESITKEVAKARNKAVEIDEILPELVEEYVETVNESS